MEGTGMERLQRCVKEGLPAIVGAVNDYLRGQNHGRIRPKVCEIEPGKAEPSWFRHFAKTQRPERTDGKSLGMYIEKLLKAEISRFLGIAIGGSSAAGVDIPELALNTKATSDRQPQSSEPFHSVYDRVLGAKYDIVVCIYNGTEFFESTGCPLRILSAQYLARTEVADNKLCATAKQLQSLASGRSIRADLAKRALRAIVYAKKGGPKRASYTELDKSLAAEDETRILGAVENCETDMAAEGEIPLPSDEEWTTFLASPLNGKIGISFALQWRYQFRSLAE